MQDSTNYGKYVEKGKILTIGGSNVIFDIIFKMYIIGN